MASTAALELILRARDEASRVVAGMAGSFGALGKAAGQAAQDLQPIGMILAGIGAAGALAIREATSEAIAFNAQAALMEVAAGDAAGGFDALHDAAIQVGGDTRLVGVSASGAADSITELYKAGLDTTDIFGDLNSYMEENAELGGVLRASIDLAAASELDMAQGAEVLSVAMATFGLEADEAVAITDNFVQTADASVASVGELTAAMMNVGPTAAAFGWELEDVNTGLALLSQRGIKGAEAGTALKSMMTNLMRPTDEVVGALNELNVSLYDSQGVMYELPEIIGQLSGAMEGLTAEQKNQYVQTLAGTYGMKAMNTLLAEGVPGWEAMEVAISEASTAQEIGAVKAATLAGQIEAFEGSLETAKIMLGEEYTPALGDAVAAGTGMLEWFNNLSPAARGATGLNNQNPD